MVHDVPATTLATPTLQCSIKMDLCASLTLVRQGLFLFLSSYCWRAPCETWSALLYFHGVHVLLVFFKSLLCIQWGKDIQRCLVGFDREDEEVCGNHLLSVCCFAASDKQPKKLCLLHQRGALPCTTERFVSQGQIHSGQILRLRSSGYFVGHSNALQQ